MVVSGFRVLKKLQWPREAKLLFRVRDKESV